MLLDEVVRDRLRSVSVTNGVSDDCCAGSTGDSERGCCGTPVEARRGTGEIEGR